MTLDTGRPLRADAARNRELIIAAAERVFAERGADAPLEEIAAEAGVGVGTLYRRFPRREDLVQALFTKRLDELVATVEEAARFPDPWKGLCHFISTACELMAGDRGLSDIVLTSVDGNTKLAASRERIAPAVDSMVGRAREAGSVRADLATTDVPMTLKMVAAIAHLTREESPDVWRRYLTIALDGMRAKGPRHTPLPSSPLSQDQVHAIMTRPHGAGSRAR